MKQTCIDDDVMLTKWDKEPTVKDCSFIVDTDKIRDALELKQLEKRDQEHTKNSSKAFILGLKVFAFLFPAITGACFVFSQCSDKTQEWIMIALILAIFGTIGAVVLWILIYPFITYILVKYRMAKYPAYREQYAQKQFLMRGDSVYHGLQLEPDVYSKDRCAYYVHLYFKYDGDPVSCNSGYPPERYTHFACFDSLLGKPLKPIYENFVIYKTP